MHPRYSSELAKGQYIVWNEAAVTRLLKLTDEGLSSRLVAIQMKTTKNSIIRKLHQLGKKGPSPVVKWTPEMDAQIIKLRGEGITRRGISAVLNVGQSALEGRIAKLITAGKLSSIRNVKDQPRKSGSNNIVSAKGFKFTKDPYDAETAEGKTFADLGRHDCRFTIGKGKFCAEPVLEGKSWCGCHFDIVYRRAAA